MGIEKHATLFVRIVLGLLALAAAALMYTRGAEYYLPSQQASIHWWDSGEVRQSRFKESRVALKAGLILTMVCEVIFKVVTTGTIEGFKFSIQGHFDSEFNGAVAFGVIGGLLVLANPGSIRRLGAFLTLLESFYLLHADNPWITRFYTTPRIDESVPELVAHIVMIILSLFVIFTPSWMHSNKSVEQADR